MPLIADKINEQMRNIGKPRTTTTTGTTDITQTGGGQSLNLGQLGMMLMLLLNMNKKPGDALAPQGSGVPSTTGGGPLPALPALPGASASGVAGAPGASGAAAPNWEQLLQVLSSLGR